MSLSTLMEGFASIFKGMSTFNLFPPAETFSTAAQVNRPRYVIPPYKRNYLWTYKTKPVADSWLLMSSAPRNGTLVLLCVVWDNENCPVIGRFDRQCNGWVSDSFKNEQLLDSKTIKGWHPIPTTFTKRKRKRCKNSQNHKDT